MFARSDFGNLVLFFQGWVEISEIVLNRHWKNLQHLFFRLTTDFGNHFSKHPSLFPLQKQLQHQIRIRFEPDHFKLGKEEQELRIELAVYFYKELNPSSGKAAKFAYLSRIAFWLELGKRGMPAMLWK